MHKMLLVTFAAVLAVLLAGCGGGSSSSLTAVATKSGHLAFSFAWPTAAVKGTRTIPTLASRLVVTVTSNRQNIASVTIVRPNTTCEMNNLPAGPVTVSVVAEDASSVVLASGATDVTLIANQTTNAAIVLKPNVTETKMTATADPLWTDTGVTMQPGQSVTFSNSSGQWTPEGASYYFDANGDPNTSVFWDLWFTSANWGALIGYLGAPGVDPASLQQNDPGFFAIGTSTINVHALPGGASHLWLGFNDDWSSHATGDNAGSVTVLGTVYVNVSLTAS